MSCIRSLDRLLGPKKLNLYALVSLMTFVNWAAFASDRPVKALFFAWYADLGYSIVHTSL